VEETPVYEEAPAVEETPVYEEAPAVEETPAYEEAPATEETEKKRIFLLEIVSELSVLYQWLLHVLFLRWCAAIC
jgi:hypothetical protein